MKKVLAILFATMFVVATTGLCFAQAAPAAPKAEQKAAAPADKATDKSKVDDKAKKAEPKKAEKKDKKEKKSDKKKAEKKPEAKKEEPKKAEEKKAPEKK